MFRAFSVDKAGAIVGVEVGPQAPRQLQIEAGGEGVALVVVEEEVAFVRRGKIGKAAGYAAGTLSVLMRVDGVELGECGDPGRGRGAFPAANASTSNGKRKENIG